MIAFACKKCGRRHRRPEGQAGTLVFCDCGQANRVPWASEVEDVPPVQPVPPTPPRRVLDAEPAPVPAPAPPTALPLPSRRPGRLLGKVNPNFCFQHADNASTAACAACRLSFCDACVIQFQGATLCGPCKNFRVASPGRARRVLPLAAVALVVALASGPVALTLSLTGTGLVRSEGLLAVAVALCLLGAALPAAALALSAVALGRLDARPEASGRGLAASGVCVSLVGVVWCATVAALLVGKHALD
jgi:hypothetical protein